jgi:hypothetical protein
VGDDQYRVGRVRSNERQTPVSVANLAPDLDRESLQITADVNEGFPQAADQQCS